MAMTQDAATGTLWALSHGRDFLNRTWGVGDEESADQPAELLVRVTSGADFGWPYCMGRWRSNSPATLVVAPEYANQAGAACATRTQPALGFPGHWAPMAVAMATEAMPEGWRHGLLIAFHGSRSRSPLPEAGHQLLYQPLDAAGLPAGEARILLRSSDRPGTLRLAGVAVAANGMVYLADDDFGRIIRIEKR
jgi:glucose/arabinose dehydrogenase